MQTDISKLRPITGASHQGFNAEVLEYTSLEGCRELITSQRIYLAYQAGLRLKMVKLTLDKSQAQLEPGALYFLKGNFTTNAAAGGKGGFGGFLQGIANRLMGKETVFRALYAGSGEIYLEPSFGHFLVYKLQEGETVIVDQGMFYCAEGSVQVGVARQKKMSAALFGGEGAYQTRLTGPGICVLASPVPYNEIIEYVLENDTLQVDGDFAVLRSQGVTFSVKRSSGSYLGSLATGEGMLQTFEGTGKVWIAPTEIVYDHLADPKFFERLVQSKGTSNSKTHLAKKKKYLPYPY